MGFLPGDLRFPRRMTGRALLHLLGRIQGQCDWTWIAELSERLSLDLDRRVRSLSRGNQQKLGIVQALMHRPELLILDEPTTALDPIVQRTVLDLLREMRDAGTTVFFSSHNITEVEKICNRVAMVRAGRLASVESVEALRLRRLARVEIRLTANQTAPAWSGVEGVIRSELRDGRHILTTRGQPGALLRMLATLEVESITWEPARLEEHFFEICEDAP
jgi:ABC-2 type transport system ATP-binding protein